MMEQSRHYSDELKSRREAMGSHVGPATDRVVLGIIPGKVAVVAGITK